MLVTGTTSSLSTQCQSAWQHRLTDRFRMVVRLVLIALIRFYQFAVRPFLIGSCKFCPSCSEYATEAIQTHGSWRGSLLAARRVLRCHPFSRGGIDPVPVATQTNDPPPHST